MKGYAHKIITASLAALMGAPAIGIAGAALGSTLPDIDIKLGIPHRTYTHYWPLYGICLGTVYYVDKTTKLTTLEHIVMEVLTWVFIGALLHIVEDSFTVMGVPWIVPRDPQRRFSFKITKTGGVFEKLMILVCVGAIYYRFPPESWGQGLLALFNMAKSYTIN